MNTSMHGKNSVNKKMRRNTYHQDENLQDTRRAPKENPLQALRIANPRPASKCFGTNETLERTDTERRDAECTPHDTN